MRTVRFLTVSHLVGLCTASSLGCGGPTQPPAQASAPPPTATPSPSPEPTATTNEEPATSNAAATADAPSAASPAETASAPPSASQAPPEVRFSAHYPPEASVSLLAWKKEQRASGPTFEQTCWELTPNIGSPPAPGLLCIAPNRQPPFTLARIYRLDGATLREVWSATIATYMNWLELTPVIATDGQSLELMDRTPYSCHAALSEYYAKRSARVAPPSGELLEPACRKVGKYAFSNGAFRFQEPPPAARPAVPDFYY